MFASLPSMSYYTGPEKLRQAIWCELFIVQKGYILHLKKWSKQSAKLITDRGSQEEDEIHNDIQRLAPGGPFKKSSESPEIAKLVAEDGLLG